MNVTCKCGTVYELDADELINGTKFVCEDCGMSITINSAQLESDIAKAMQQIQDDLEY